MDSDTLVLGCSVSQQLFPFMARKNYKTTTAIDLLASSYIFASKAIKNNPGLRNIVIITVPNSLFNPFESEYTYNLFVKPYFHYKNLEYFDAYLIKKIAQEPCAMPAIFSFFKMLPISDFNYKTDRPLSASRLSEFAVHFLRKLNRLAKDNNVKIVFIASPLREKAIADNSGFQSLKEDIAQYEFKGMLDGYFESIVTYPDSCFRDGMHFKESYLTGHRMEIISKLKL
jgi:hypothetical protein